MASFVRLSICLALLVAACSAAPGAVNMPEGRAVTIESEAEEGLLVNPKSYVKLHAHVQQMSADEAAHIQECHDSASRCRVSHEAMEKMGLKEGAIVAAFPQEGDSSTGSVIMRVGRISRDATHAEFDHTKPLASELIEEADIEVTTVSAFETLADGTRVRRRGLLSSLLGFLTSDQEYKVNDYITAYKKGPNFNLAVKSFRFQINLQDGLKVFELILRASSKASIGIKAESPKLLSYDVEFLDTGKITLGSFSFAAGPVPISVSLVARNYLEAIVDLDSQFKLDYGFQAEGFIEFGFTYDTSVSSEFQTVFNRGFSTSRYGQITIPTFALTATIQSVAELSAQIGIGIGPARVDFFGPYFRLIPGVVLKLNFTNYDARFFLDSKVGIKGPDWQVLWFKISLEWGKSFRLYEKLLDSGTWGSFKFTQYIAAALFDSTPAPLTDTNLATGVQMDSSPPPAKTTTMVDYVVTTYTGFLDGAGTDADVWVQFYSDTGDISDKIWLDTTNDDFEKGKVDTFLVKGPQYNRVTRVKVGHDGSGIKPAWYLDRITVQQGASRVTAFARQWVDADGSSAAVALLPAVTDSEYAAGVFRVSIKAGGFPNAGTCSLITVSITGTAGSRSVDVIPTATTFKNSTTDIVEIYGGPAGSSVGEVIALGLSTTGKNEYGNTDDAPWYIENAVVTAPDGTKKLFAPRQFVGPAEATTTFPAVTADVYNGYKYRFIVKVGTGSSDGTGVGDDTKDIKLTINGDKASATTTAGTSLKSGDARPMAVWATLDCGTIRSVTLCNAYYNDDLVTTGIVVRDTSRMLEYTFSCQLSLGCYWYNFFSCTNPDCATCKSPSVAQVTP